MEESYPRKFDRSSLTEVDEKILIDFQSRRRILKDFVIEMGIPAITCPGCGFPTLKERGCYEICLVCNWEDDGQDDDRADEIWGGPNYQLSLTENRLQIGKQLLEIGSQDDAVISKSPSDIYRVVQEHRKRLDKFAEKIPMDATLEHPFWKKYALLKKEVLLLLIK